MTIQQILKYVQSTDENCFSIKRVYDKENILSHIYVFDEKGRIYKCLFYEKGTRLSNLSVYNRETGKEIRNITYRQDGKTISSVREYNLETGILSCVTFFKSDGVSVSSIIEYDDYGAQVQFSLFCDDGEVITSEL